MLNCIYCGATDVTTEHPLPRGLGKFKDYVPLTDRLCSRCNGIFGQLDEQLCRCGMEAFFRKYLGISGRSGHDDVNSFYRGSSRGGRLEMVGVSHETGEESRLRISTLPWMANIFSTKVRRKWRSRSKKGPSSSAPSEVFVFSRNCPR